MKRCRLSFRFVSAAVGLALVSSSGLAGETTKIAVTGQETRVAALGSMGSGCKPNPAPDVSVAQNASYGVIRIVSATMKTNRFRQCPEAEIPVKVVFYKSQPNYVGEDKVVLDVSFVDGTASSESINITVK
jgi:hypothetical protein